MIDTLLDECMKPNAKQCSLSAKCISSRAYHAASRLAEKEGFSKEDRMRFARKYAKKICEMANQPGENID
eukprot:6789704-Karenia_brevis.AAC.1